jgi:hypothetical protein
MKGKLTAKPFAISKNWLALGRAVSPGPVKFLRYQNLPVIPATQEVKTGRIVV